MYFCIYSLKTRAIVVLLLTFVGVFWFVFIYMVDFSDGFKENLNTRKMWGK